MKRLEGHWLRLGLVLVLGLALVAWWHRSHESSTDLEAAGGGSNTGLVVGADASLGRVLMGGATKVGVAQNVELSPSAVEMGELLHAPGGSGEDDNGVVEQMLGDFRKWLGQGNPEGMNEDITAALLGENPRRLAFLPADHAAIRGGSLVDRWGTPYWFHAESSQVMEIRSGGPDRQLFTGDDLVLNDTGVESTLYGEGEGEGEGAGE